MKKNNSKKLILTAILFFSGGAILPLGNQYIVNAAHEEQIDEGVQKDVMWGELHLEMGNMGHETNIRKEENFDEENREEKEESEDNGNNEIKDKENIDDEAVKEETEEGEKKNNEEEEAVEEGGEIKRESENDIEEGEEIKKESENDIEEGGEIKRESENDIEEGEEIKKESENDIEEGGEIKKESENDIEEGEEIKKESENNIEEGEEIKKESKKDIEQIEECNKESTEDVEEEEKNNETYKKDTDNKAEQGENKEIQINRKEENLNEARKENEKKIDSIDSIDSIDRIEVILTGGKYDKHEKNWIETDSFTKHFSKSDEIPEKVIIQQVIIPAENKAPSSVTNILEDKVEKVPMLNQNQYIKETEHTQTNFCQDTESKIENALLQTENIKESDILQKEKVEEGLVNIDLLENKESPSENDFSIGTLQDLFAPVIKIDDLTDVMNEKEVRFRYFIDDENLLESQMKVFFTSQGKEELILQENHQKEGEFIFDKEGNYLIYLYAKDSSGNESRVYQSYSLGSKEIELDELNQLENKEVVLEEMDLVLEDMFEGSNIATYQIYINGEQYKKEESNIPEGKCILTIELEDTHGNSSQKTIEVISKSSMKEEHEEENIVSKNSEILQYEQLQDEQLQEKDEVTEQIDENINDKFKYTIDEKTGEEIVYDEKEKRHSNNSIEIAGVIGSLVSGLLIIFKRIKH